MIFGMGDTAVASILAAAIAGVVAWLTARSNKKGQVAAAEAAASAAVANQTLSSRTDIEKEAFERARSYYTDVTDRQQIEITGLEISERELKDRVNELEQGRREDHHKIQHLEDRVRALEIEKVADGLTIDDLKGKLAVATTLLEQKYKDE